MYNVFPELAVMCIILIIWIYGWLWWQTRKPKETDKNQDELKKERIKKAS